MCLSDVLMGVAWDMLWRSGWKDEQDGHSRRFSLEVIKMNVVLNYRF